VLVAILVHHGDSSICSVHMQRDCKRFASGQVHSKLGTALFARCRAYLTRILDHVHGAVGLRGNAQLVALS